jgi:hypothetical protein
MSDPRGWPFGSADLLQIPFIFVPDGHPAPREWLARHPGAIRVPARFVPSGKSGTSRDGAIQADLNGAMIHWLGWAAGVGGATIAQPNEAGAQPSHEAGLAELLAADSSGASERSLPITNQDAALTGFFYRPDENVAAPASQPGLEARLAVWPTVYASDGGEGSWSGTTLEPALMKFILGTYGDPGTLAPQLDRELGTPLQETLPAGWSPLQDAPAAPLADLQRHGAVSEPAKAQEPLPELTAKKLRQPNGTFASPSAVTEEQLAVVIFNETQSLSGPGLISAQEQIGFVYLHRAANGNTRGVAPTSVTPQQQKTPQYTQAKEIAESILNGTATDGGTNNVGYNMRTTNSSSNNRNYRPPLSPSMHLDHFRMRSDQTYG